jgi:hypothetical protein
MPRLSDDHGCHCTHSAGAPCHDPCHERRVAISSYRTRSVSVGPTHAVPNCSQPRESSPGRSSTPAPLPGASDRAAQGRSGPASSLPQNKPQRQGIGSPTEPAVPCAPWHLRPEAKYRHGLSGTAARLNWNMPSVSVRWRPPLAVAIVTHLVTQSLPLTFCSRELCSGVRQAVRAAWYDR